MPPHIATVFYSLLQVSHPQCLPTSLRPFISPQQLQPLPLRLRRQYGLRITIAATSLGPFFSPFLSGGLLFLIATMEIHGSSHSHNKWVN
ncbi:hypothetical protein S83_047809 [Arachis hypogaea]